MCKQKIVFLGDSLTANFNMLDNYENVINLGIGGDKTTEVLPRLNEVYKYNPHKLFFHIGINDYLVNKKVWDYPDEIYIANNFEEILKRLKENLPDTKFYSISIFPVGKCTFLAEELLGLYNEEIVQLNDELKKISDEYNFEYIDINDIFKGNNGNLKDEYTIDGIHLSEIGYTKYLEAIKEKLI